jgi:CDP-6-deoxy-D-xylo-4-hexulose-3-dehydrase
LNDLDRSHLRAVVNQALETSSDFVPGITPIPLSVPTFGADEILEAIDSLLSSQVTMGKKVANFEKAFSDYIGVRNSIMVNSGSSANLITLSVLASKLVENGVRPGDEVITPALTWSTTVFPIMMIGAIPVFVDVELDTFCIDPRLVERAITHKTKAIMPVHLLGNPCDMKAIGTIASQHDLFTIEDSCEAPGAQIDGKRVGSFGDMGAFSFYFSHHITTIEGGMVVTNNDRYANLARSLRAHGWIRERSDRENLAAQYPAFDRRFLFVSPGYNLRPTEIQGAFGIHQIKKLEQLIRVREENANYWTNELSRYRDFLILPTSRPGFRHVYFGYQVTVRPEASFTRDELISYLESKRIETRPIMAGDFTQQPACEVYPYRIADDLRNSKFIHSQSLLWGNHHGIGTAQRKYIIDCIAEFIETQGSQHKGTE